jgi:predicted metal-binding membrane protein
MWQLMMVSMMMPVVWPWLRVVAVTHARDGHGPVFTVVTFACGYFTAWLLYATVAASLQVGLQSTHLLDASLVVPAPWPGFVLVLAGLFQFSRLKHACLAHCRSPFTYLLTQWHDGPPSVYGVGLKHGLYCIACCWALMVLGFALGLMNLTWMAMITVIAAIEQIAPGGGRFARAAGAALIAWGIYSLGH